jgi:hypothetical protein
LGRVIIGMDLKLATSTLSTPVGGHEIAFQ